MSTMFRIGIMSFAHPHAGAYITSLLEQDDVELLTADPGSRAAPSEELRGAAYAQQFGAAYVQTYDELFAWQPDAVIVCSENSQHRADVELASREGAHVLCEKPLATRTDDAQAMIDACQAAGVKLMSAFPMRFTATFTALQEAIEAGALGDILGATGVNNGKLPIGDRSWFTDPELAGGGALMDLTVHIADLLDSLLQPVVARTVFATTNRILHGNAPHVRSETGGLVNIVYENGVVATIDSSWSHPSSAPNWGGLTLEIVGTEGIAEIDPFGLRISGFDEQHGQELWLAYGARTSDGLIEEFLSALQQQRDPEPSGAAGLRTVAIVSAAQESARTGKPVTC